MGNRPTKGTTGRIRTLLKIRILCLFGFLFSPMGCQRKSAPPLPVKSAPPLPVLAVQPLGQATSLLWLRWLQRALRPHAKLIVLQPRPLPPQAWSATYQRHRAERLCEILALWKPKEARYILGLTAVDVSTTLPGYVDHAVFGLSDRGGPASVLSTYRLRFLKLTPKQNRQLWNILVHHEWGHLQNLTHCKNPRCVMHNAANQTSRLLKMLPKRCKQCLDRSKEKL